jgi:porphobilinogen synthase
LRGQGDRLPGPGFRRNRRLRSTERLRESLRETHVRPQQLILPVFLDPSVPDSCPLGSLPGHRLLSVGALSRLAERADSAGLGGLLLFGRPRRKDPRGRGAWDPKGVVPEALRRLSGRTPLTLYADVCLCAYTVDGHCGYWTPRGLDNEATLEALARTALAYARAGASFVAPSAMVDGQVRTLRMSLDAAGLEEVGILSYSAKSASAFYDPFRDAEDSAPRKGDRRGYQMDPSNAREALREIGSDIEEGADIVMVKPGLVQLDLLCRARERFGVPLAVYHTSGEFAMMKAAAERGWVREESAVPEVLRALRRAGADLIITYYALEAAEKGWL